MRPALWGLIVLAGFAACDDGGGEDPPAAVTFVEVRERVLEASCAFMACHSGASPAGMLGLQGEDAHAQLIADSPMAGKPRVVPGDSASSYLMEKLSAPMPAFGDPMPPPAPLEAERLELVRAWIDDGAPAE